jgi:hypothetical protein
MKVLRATVVIALLAGPAYVQAAYAQDNHIQRYGEPDKEKSQTEIQADKAAERAYNRSLGNIPDGCEDRRENHGGEADQNRHRRHHFQLENKQRSAAAGPLRGPALFHVAG